MASILFAAVLIFGAFAMPVLVARVVTRLAADLPSAQRTNIIAAAVILAALAFAWGVSYLFATFGTG